MSFGNRKKLKEGCLALLFKQLNADQLDDEPLFYPLLDIFLVHYFCLYFKILAAQLIIQNTDGAAQLIILK